MFWNKSNKINVFKEITTTRSYEVPRRGYSSAVAREVLDVSQRCLDYWAERGVVRASIQEGHGKGSERKYSFDDLVKLALVKKLRDAGLSLQKIRKGLEIMRKRWPKEDPLLQEMLATDGCTFFRLKGDQVEDLLAGGQLLLSIVAVGRIRQDVRANALKFPGIGDSARGRPARAVAAAG
jgi:DNA-binding transcriptional MerR regulator